MKKFITIITAICLALGMNAQPSQQQARPDGKGRQQNHQEMMSRLQSEHIAFLSSELELTPEEAEVFWPVYNKAQKEQRENHKLYGTAFKNLKAALRENKSEKEVKEALNAYNKAKKEQKNVLAEYQDEFVKILGVQKTAKLYVAEDSFRTRQIHKLGDGRKDPQARPQGNRSGKPQGEKGRSGDRK